MVNIKQKVEQYFIDSWTGAPFNFQGNDIEAVAPFFTISFVPLEREAYSFGGACSRKRDTAYFKISSYETNPTKCIILDDEVRAFLECYNVDSVQLEEGKPDGLGIVDLENGLFESVTNYGATQHN